MSIQDLHLPKEEDYEQLQETFDTFLKVKSRKAEGRTT